MRTIILFVLLAFVSRSVFPQVPTKKEMQEQMLNTINVLNNQIADLEKKITEAKKNKEVDETIKELEDQVTMLKKQVAMMGGVSKGISKISEKTFQQANEEEAIVPQKDAARINSLPKKILTEAELLVFIKNVHAGVEKIIPAEEKKAALDIYNETKAQYKSAEIVGNAASGCWMLGHWEKALFLMGKACMDSIADADNLNNYAAFLINTGAEQAALPILEYLNSKYPDNSTIQNNIGQAWFGLGETDKAKKCLDSATNLYPNHSMANSTLSKLSLSHGDTINSIAFLKASLKESYDPEKEQELLKVGYEIKFADMPPLNYPMKNDPFGLIPLIKSWDPNKIQSSIADGATALAMQRYLNGVRDFGRELADENMELNNKLVQRGNKLSEDSFYRREFLDPHNCPGYLVAARSLQLYRFENPYVIKTFGGKSSLFIGLRLPYQKPLGDLDKLLSVEQIRKDCEMLWFKEVLEPLEVLGQNMTGNSEDCADYDAKMNAYLAKRKSIYSRGVKLIQNEFIKNSDRLTTWIKYNLYGAKDDPPKDMNDLSTALISDVEFKIGRSRIRNQEYAGVLSLIEMANKFESRYRSACDKNPTPDPDAAGDVLTPLKVRTVECEYIKRVITPVRYEFVLHCNTITERKNPKLPKRKTNVPKGSVQSSKPRLRDVLGPLQQVFRNAAHGPNNFADEMEEEQTPNQQSPLTAENKDMSQFSIEYDKWGNLVGFNFQLNEDGTNLKDPDSIESGVDSRWSWNAIASSKKGFLNKLLIK